MKKILRAVSGYRGRIRPVRPIAVLLDGRGSAAGRPCTDLGFPADRPAIGQGMIVSGIVPPPGSPFLCLSCPSLSIPVSRCHLGMAPPFHPSRSIQRRAARTSWPLIRRGRVSARPITQSNNDGATCVWSPYAAGISSQPWHCPCHDIPDAFLGASCDLQRPGDHPSDACKPLTDPPGGCPDLRGRGLSGGDSAHTSIRL